jgi:hypothetical protein
LILNLERLFPLPIAFSRTVWRTTPYGQVRVEFGTGPV